MFNKNNIYFSPFCAPCSLYECSLTIVIGSLCSNIHRYIPIDIKAVFGYGYTSNHGAIFDVIKVHDLESF